MNLHLDRLVTQLELPHGYFNDEYMRDRQRFVFQVALKSASIPGELLDVSEFLNNGSTEP